MTRRRTEPLVPAEEIEANEADAVAAANPETFMRRSRVAAIGRAVERGMPLEDAEQTWGLVLTGPERDRLFAHQTDVTMPTPFSGMS